MLLLTKKNKKSHNKQKLCHLCKEEFIKNFHEDKNYCKVQDHSCYTGKYKGLLIVSLI